jgi:hypothetical protein
VAIVFILALLVDSACAAACIPAELRAPEEHCASGHPGADSPERGCDRNGHLKPVVKDRGFVAATETGDAPASFDRPTDIHFESFGAAPGREAPFHLPPLFQRSTVLRI